MDENPYKAPADRGPPEAQPYRLNSGDVLAMAIVSLTLSTVLFALVNFMAGRN